MKKLKEMRNVEAKEQGDSWGYRGRWQVNSANMWIATLGRRLNLENAILGHSVIMIHEMTHAFSGERRCKASWDPTIEKILKEVLRKEITESKIWE